MPNLDDFVADWKKRCEYIRSIKLQVEQAYFLKKRFVDQIVYFLGLDSEEIRFRLECLSAELDLALFEAINNYQFESQKYRRSWFFNTKWAGIGSWPEPPKN